MDPVTALFGEQESANESDQSSVENGSSELHQSEDLKIPTMGRRSLIGGLLGTLTAAVSALFGKRRPRSDYLLRPPGALPENQFLSSCARCFKCANVCPNDCIDFHGIRDGLAMAFTPYIKARTSGCILCGECANVCPTGALKPFEPTQEGWLKDVKMGTARVNTDMCFSYHGRTCGACYRSCPLAGTAMTIGVFETPIIHPEACVGCGLCEQSCLHLPQAIRVIPHRG